MERQNRRRTRLGNRGAFEANEAVRNGGVIRDASRATEVADRVHGTLHLRDPEDREQQCMEVLSGRSAHERALLQDSDCARLAGH